MRLLGVAFAAVMVVGLCGCGANYKWHSDVPKTMRTVSVSTFRNESDVNELGAIATRQILREIQREGTFSIRDRGEAALEVQGVIKSANNGVTGYDRSTGMRLAAYDFSAVAEVTIVDKRSRKVLIDNRQYTAHTTFTASQDLSTAKRDASGRLMDDLSRQVVDDMLRTKWEGYEK